MNETISAIVINLISSLIYSGISAGIQHTPFKKSHAIERRLKKEISKSVKREMEKLLEQSRVFDSNAFAAYLQSMQPLQKIYANVCNSMPQGDITGERLIAEMVNDTIAYLRREKVEVTPLDEGYLREFYCKVMKICGETMFSQMEGSDQALAKLLNKITEKSGKDTAKAIQQLETSNRINAEKMGNALGRQIQQCFAELTPDVGKKVSVALRRDCERELLPYKYQEGSDKEQLVKQLLVELKQYDWIHIYGKVFSGKTQVLIRLAERVASFAWLRADADKFFDIDLSTLQLEADTVIILDGIPKASDRKVQQKCLELFAQAQKKNCK